MPSAPKTTKSSNASTAKKATGSSRTRSTPRARATSRSTTSAAPKARAPKAAAEEVSSIGTKVDAMADKARDGARTVAKGTAAAAVATAAAAFAGRALISSRQRKRVLGVPMPRRRTNMKGVAKQFSSVAAELEKKSLDVSKASGRAKQAANILT